MNRNTLIDVKKVEIHRSCQFAVLEKRMLERACSTRKNRLERASARWDQSVTFYYGNLAKEEQKYRDYDEIDLEKYPENDKVEEKPDEKKQFSVKMNIS